jgi:hypothetical protein
MEQFFDDLPAWFVERAAPAGCLHVVDWRWAQDMVADLLADATTQDKAQRSTEASR